MDEKEIRQQIETLREQLHYHNYLYHTLDAPVISDYDYDQLYKRLKELESAHPELITADSPTQRSGGQPLDKFRKVEHPSPIQSLANGFGRQDTLDWYERILRLDPAVARADYVLEPKLDGLTVVLTYENGSFVLGATRGDGLVGEDVTENLRTIPTLPLRIPVMGGGHAPARLVVRGEAIMFKDDFERLNAQLEQRGEKTYLNPRNTAAGSLRQLDPAVTAKRPLKIFLYQILESSEETPNTQSEILDYLMKLGFPVNPLRWHANNIEEAVQICEAQALSRHTWAYDADGIVIKINDQALSRRLGFSGKDPRGALAFKYPGQEVETTLLDIQVNVGRTGVLTPLAVLKPVSIGGVIVRQATLHNFDFIRDKDIRIGDQVLLKRAGEVIPYILGPLPEKRDGTEKTFEIPRECPSCGSPIQKVPEEVAYYCVNSSCPAQLVRNLENFASRGALDISGLGSQIVAQLVESGLVNSAADLYTLKRDALMKLDKFGEKKAENLLQAVESSKQQPLERLIIGLGIHGVGEVAARKLARQFLNLDALSRASLDELTSLEGIGPGIAASITGWFAQPHNQELLQKLRANGVWPQEHETKENAQSGALAGKTFVITGTLPTLSREQAERLILEHGGTISSSVSKKTDYLLLGENPGSKYAKALELGIPILDEDSLRQMLT
ncbi:MAG TPA: NAD-dependent DNA ligase LigA [Anaerolineaceae bacterium]|nr:NAD-dependent DNA ligase LigA [Anaerolineales bacterium]HOG58230.1 NAD-dependent DNA ligase LigA [Anaerolineaceae bacterium]HOR84500.1 NAD-dependent DNA ligase LigA [Anaerolineaceae bacterium]HPL43085.1 NAD-dependent DNA ligase LigA [Anaerolineaceae bacterium]HPY33870.1 NAD-dependent DNA ligase LigA [Anaerolineaceae bacterium]